MNSKEQKNTSIHIFDILGKEIQAINFSGKQLVIEKGNMQPGIYIIRAIANRLYASSEKVMIE